MLSDRLKAWLLGRAEKSLGVYREADEPPERLREQAADWGNQHPRATRREWFEFAVGLAEQAWRSAYIRGVEWAERDAEKPGAEGPDEVADRFWGKAWREVPWRPELAFEVGVDDVPQEAPTTDDDEQAAQVMALLDREGIFRKITVKAPGGVRAESEAEFRTRIFRLLKEGR